MNIDLEFEKARVRVHKFINDRVDDELWKTYIERIKSGCPTTAIVRHKINHQGLMVKGINC